jgi:4-amino-4-deoxy-L-arabinose transferase-like glycosyltransferase
MSGNASRTHLPHRPHNVLNADNKILSEAGSTAISADQTMQDNRKITTRTRLLLIVLAALAVRLIVVCFIYKDLPDADKFYERFGWEMGWVGRALASGHGFSSPYWPWSGPTAMQPPLYPALLSVVFRIFGVYTLTSAFVILSLNSLLSAFTCIPIYFSAKFSLGQRAAIIAAGVWAFYPFAIYFAADRVWEYSLTALLFTTCFCIAQRIHTSSNPYAWIGWGALVGLTALSNPATLGTLPFLLLLALWQVRSSGRPWGTKGLLTAATLVVVLLPWTIRNYKELGILCPVRDNFWLELYDDNGGDASLDPNFAHPNSNPVEMQKWLSMGETNFLRQKHQLAIGFIRNHPGFFIHKTIRRTFYYWTGFWSLSSKEIHEQPYEPFNILYVCTITFFMLRGARRLWRIDRTAVLPYLVLLCVFPITYYVTHPLMDYRQPIEPAIVVLAIAGALPFKRIADTRPTAWTGDATNTVSS